MSPPAGHAVRPGVVGRVLVGIGVVGVLAGLVGAGVGLAFVTSLDRALEDSLGVTGQAVDALGASVEVAAETLEVVETTLTTTAATTRDLGASLDEARAVLVATAELSEDDLATSLEAVQDTLPALIQVAAVIDTTLSALSAIPFGPDYAPSEPFPTSLRAVQAELDGIPESLREQAVLIRDGADSLGTVQAGTAAIADDLDLLQATLGRAGELVDDYAATATQARTLVADNQSALDRQLAWARVLVVLLALSFVAGQVVPLGLGWLLLDPARLPRFLGAQDPGVSASAQ